MRLTMSASVERSMPVRSTSPVWLSPRLRHGDQHGELTRGQIAVLHLGMEDVSCALAGPVQKMDG